MSPTTFKFQVAQLQSELTFCIQYCQDIRTNRHLAGTKNLDGLQNALESAEISIPNNFNTFRRIAGSQLDAGDDRARREMNQHILDVQSKIKPQLKEIAHPSRKSDKHERQRAGFKDLLREWEFIFHDVSDTMRSLSRRIELYSTDKPDIKTAEPKTKKTDEVTITLKELDHLLDHIKNSWEESIVAGAFMYTNAFDKKQQRERPENGFIKMLPRSTRPRTPSWDQPTRTSSVKTASWEVPSRSKVRSWETRHDDY